jgi:hypothetical protein
MVGLATAHVHRDFQVTGIDKSELPGTSTHARAAVRAQRS